MKIRNLAFFLVACVTTSMYSQKDSEVLFKVADEPVLVSEFKRVYEKNVDILSDDNQKGVENYLDLFVKYKLKLREAYYFKLDTTRAYKRELESYKNQLITPYLQDDTYLEELVKDTYFRTKYMVNVSHVLVKVSKNATPLDTLTAYHKIVEAKRELENGNSFSKVALKYSDDPSAKSNFGNLGYFTAFKMVYPFESAAYTTKVGEISKIFKTRFGYHFVRVNELQLSKGEIEVAHILITDKSSKGKVIADSIYNSLKEGADFNKLVLKYSKDKNSISNEGKLPKFGMGRMLKPFEEAAFLIQNVNEYSTPFKTRFGWHIIKLLHKHPVKLFKELKNDLAEKVKDGGVGNLSDLIVLAKLKKKYKIVVIEKSKLIFDNKNIRSVNKNTLQQVVLSINEKQIKQDRFFDYIRNRNHKQISLLFTDFLNDEVLTYFKENLKYTEPEFAIRLKEYEEGLLIFDFMQQKVWRKSANDTLGLQSYFDENKLKYSFKELNKNKGQVMNDYQTFLEEKLIQVLQKKYPVIIQKSVVNKLVKYYK